MTMFRRKDCRMSRTTSTFTWLGLASLLVTLTACSGHGGGAPGAGQGGGVPVEAMTLHLSNIPQAQDYQATLISRHSVVLQPQVAGQIAEIYVKAGDHVRAGTPLLLIDPRRQQASLASSKADAAALLANIKQASDNVASLQEQRKGLESNVQVNQQQYTRYSNLFSQGAASRQVVEQYLDALNKARADLNANAAQIQAQRSAVVTAQKTYQRALAGVREQNVQLQYYRVTAPYAGIVGDIPVKVGNYVTTDTQLLSVTDNDPLELNIGLPADRAFDIRTGLPVQVLDNNGKPQVDGRLSFVSPNVNAGTQTILVKAIISNPTGLLKADQSVRARVIYSEKPGVAIPASAVSHLGGQDFAFLIVDKAGQHVVKQQPVTLGGIQNNQYVVLQGLKDGDLIVAQGIQKLMDGVPVTILPKGQ
jgi:multidrug efflux pump subunit AcrA (membrane-fusion protein)